MDAGLPVAAAGPHMDPERAAAPYGGRSIGNAPPTGHNDTGENLHATQFVGCPATIPPARVAIWRPKTSSAML